MSGSLRAAVETPKRIDYGGEDTPEHGLELQEEQWHPPATITADMVVEAGRWLQAYRMENGDVQDGVLKQWLGTLIVGMATSLGERDIEWKIKTLAFAVAPFPASLFTADSLRLAMAEFAFIPTAHELIAFLKRLQKAERDTADRLETIVNIGVRANKRAEPNWTPAPERRQRSPEELKAVGDICAGIRARLAEAQLERPASYDAKRQGAGDAEAVAD